MHKQPAAYHPNDPLVEAREEGRFTPLEASSTPKQRRLRPQQPRAPPDYLNRRDLLALVPLSMSSIDELEKRGIFLKRFRIEPLNRVIWKRREVVRFMERRAKQRRYAPVVEPSNST
jgi:predicted DNA-binding transcriptional regulator AlpA